MRVRIGTLLFVVGCCLLFAPQARATDYAYGYTSVYVDSGNVVRGYHRTEVDYNTDVYYRPYVCASLYKDGVEVVRACQGGFASATRNTQTVYAAGSMYSALSDHYVNIEYEDEDPNNPGYYYYQDYLGYYFSGGGSHPIDWYYVASGIYNMRPDESIHLGDTTGIICSKPTDETTLFIGWADSQGYPTVGRWSQTLLPSTTSFSGRTVTEQDPGGGTDGCREKYPQSEVPPQTQVNGTFWGVGSGNTWGTDDVGLYPEVVIYYRLVNAAPCTVTVPQRMVIDCSIASTVSYKYNTLSFTIGTTTVSSTRAGATAVRTWPQ